MRTLCGILLIASVLALGQAAPAVRNRFWPPPVRVPFSGEENANAEGLQDTIRTLGTLGSLAGVFGENEEATEQRRIRVGNVARTIGTIGRVVGGFGANEKATEQRIRFGDVLRVIDTAGRLAGGFEKATAQRRFNIGGIARTIGNAADRIESKDGFQFRDAVNILGDIADNIDGEELATAEGVNAGDVVRVIATLGPLFG